MVISSLLSQGFRESFFGFAVDYLVEGMCEEAYPLFQVFS